MISNIVKIKLQTDIYDNNFLIITQLTNLYASKNNAEFIRLTRKYYSLRFEDFDFIIFYLT